MKSNDKQLGSNIGIFCAEIEVVIGPLHLGVVLYPIGESFLTAHTAKR